MRDNDGWLEGLSLDICQQVLQGKGNSRKQDDLIVFCIFLLVGFKYTKCQPSRLSRAAIVGLNPIQACVTPIFSS